MLRGTDGPQSVVLYAISGLGFTPTYIWLTDDSNLFAFGDRYYMTIARGYESAAGQLSDIQDQEQSANLARLAKTLSHGHEEIVLRDISVFDTENAKVLPHQTVVIPHGHIQSLSRFDQSQQFPSDA